MTLDALLEAVPPPETPFEAFDGPWEPIERIAGSPLPQDYKDFVRIYGAGYFMEFLGVAVPRSSNPNTCFEARLSVVSQSFESDEDLPYPMWPAPGGLIPFGGTDEGDELFWLSQGDPDDWKVVIWSRGSLEFEVLDDGLAGFLAGLATGETIPADFPEPSFFLEAEPFQPNSRWAT